MLLAVHEYSLCVAMRSVDQSADYQLTSVLASITYNASWSSSRSVVVDWIGRQVGVNRPLSTELVLQVPEETLVLFACSRCSSFHPVKLYLLVGGVRMADRSFTVLEGSIAARQSLLGCSFARSPLESTSCCFYVLTK